MSTTNKTLAEQLRDHAEWVYRHTTTALHAPTLYSRAADELDAQQATLTAQARLLALAEKLATAAVMIELTDGPDPGQVEAVIKAARAFDLAQLEDTFSSAVPCPECEALKADFDTLIQVRDALREEKDALRKELDAVNAGWKADQKSLNACYELIHKAEAERDDLRRQLAEAQAARLAYASEFPSDSLDGPDVGRIHENIRALKESHFALSAALSEAQADNAALVEALERAITYVPERIRSLRDGDVPLKAVLSKILSQPHPGAAMQERMANLERENEALRKGAEKVIDLLGDDHDPDAHPNDKPPAANEEECFACQAQGILAGAIRNREGR